MSNDNPFAVLYDHPLAPPNIAIKLIRAKFGGLIPETITPKECLELMQQFAEYESRIAEEYRRIATDAVNCRPVPPLIISS